LWGSGGASPYASPATAALMALGSGDASGTNWAELQVEDSFRHRWPMASAVEGLHTTAALLSGICWAPFEHAGGAARVRQSPCIALLLGVQVFRRKLCLILKLSVMTVTWTSIFFLNVLL